MINDKFSEKSFDDLFNDKKKKYGYTSIIKKTVNKARNLFYGLGLGVILLSSFGYYSFINLKEETQEIIKKEISNSFNDSELIAGVVGTTVDNKVNDYLQNNYNEINNYTKESIDKAVKTYVVKKKEIKINVPVFNNISEELNYLNGNIDYLIHVDKNNNILRLVDVKSDKIIYSFSTTDGLNQGTKKISGDHKTPEGIYNINYVKINEINSKDYNEYFGTVRFGINYPNSFDYSQGRNGDGILICGTSDSYRLNAISKKQDVTFGAVSLKNQDIEKIFNKININKTIIAIEDVKRPLDLSLYQKEINSVR